MINSVNFLLVFVTILMGLLKIFQKQISKYFEADTFTYLIQVVSILIMIPMFIFFVDFKFKPSLFNIILVIGAGFSWYIGSLVTNRSIKESDLTLREPIIQTRTVFVIIISVLFLKENVSFAELAGGLLVFVGAVVSSFKEKIDFRNIRKDGLFLCFAAAFLIAISYSFDKYALNFIDVLSWVFCMYLIPLIFLLPKTKNVITDIKRQKIKNLLSLFFVIILGSIAYILLIFVLSKTNLSKTFPISQLSSIFVFLGGLYLGERNNIYYRTIGSVVSLIGGVLIFLN